ncbi:MAG: type II toxin-antitoxin system VapC family toxin [Verrucomicrobia bacterium]|nr:type II toxin-antitoxin system VapC family toxin [Verrucomicrobiota bacterium]
MTLLDANVLLDIFTDDPSWADRSEEMLLEAMQTGSVGINPIIYAEISYGFSTESQLDRALTELGVERWLLPYEAAFPAANAYQRYRKQKGLRRSPLPDFYIGAHAMVKGCKLMTRDVARYKTYFPTVELIHP